MSFVVYSFPFPPSSLTVLVHMGVKAFLESTRSALVPVGLVDGTLPVGFSLGLASVHSVSMYTSLEEARTTLKVSTRERERERRRKEKVQQLPTVAGINAVVFTRTSISAYTTRDVK